MFAHTDVVIDCSAWKNCSTHVYQAGCTFYDLFVHIQQNPAWSQFNSGDLVQQPYNTVIDSVNHLCSNIEPGRDTRYSAVRAKNCVMLLLVEQCG